MLGVLVSDPLDKHNVMMFGVGALLLLLPLLLRWYHAWLIVVWNMTVTFIYFPGMLPGWMPMATMTLEATFNACTRTSRCPFVIGSKDPG